jgi:putative phosphoesterase
MFACTICRIRIVTMRPFYEEIGLVSDSHGPVRASALSALVGVARIIHAGDVGNAEVLGQLAEVAPVVAIRGNNDRGAWAESLPQTEVVEIGRTLVYVIHDLGELDLDPAAAGFHAVVSGHSHRPKIERREGVLYVNPGSIGPRRFKFPIALALLRIQGTELDARIVELED